MGRNSIILKNVGLGEKILEFLLIIAFLTTIGQAQTLKSSSLKSKYLFEPISIIDLEGTAFQGQFMGLDEDSLFILTPSGNHGFALSSLRRVKVSSSSAERTYTTMFSVVGAFLGQFLLEKPDWQADRFTQSGSYMTNILSGLAGSSVLGGLGFFVDLIFKDHTGDFTLFSDEEVNKMRKELLQGEESPLVNFYYSMTHVFASHQINSTYYNYSREDIVNFNTFRNFRVGVRLNNRLEVGGAIYSVAEPNIRTWANISAGYYNISINNKITGYYLTGSYFLHGSDPGSAVTLSPVAGIGIARINYELSQKKSSSYVYPPDYNAVYSTYEKTEFSYFGALELRFYPSRMSSIALVCDYVYVPGHASASLVKGESGKSFSNFSLGLSMGLHF